MDTQKEVVKNEWNQSDLEPTVYNYLFVRKQHTVSEVMVAITFFRFLSGGFVPAFANAASIWIVIEFVKLMWRSEKC